MIINDLDIERVSVFPLEADAPLLVDQRTHERWSMDFVHDQLFDGRPFRVLTPWSRLNRYSRRGDVAHALRRQADS
jgi:hypothetical protein